jgi:hypothetical protein
MAENAGDDMTTPPKATVESFEAEIARTRQRLSVTLGALNGDLRALLNPDIAIAIDSAGHRDAADKVAVGLRTAGQIRALVRPKRGGYLGIATTAASVAIFLFRSGIARPIWSGRAEHRDKFISAQP